MSVGPIASDGFGVHASGLLVPKDYERRRSVLTKDETKLLNRTIRTVLGPHALTFSLSCDREGCPDPRIQRVKMPGRFVLRCGCSDRILERAF